VDVAKRFLNKLQLQSFTLHQGMHPNQRMIFLQKEKKELRLFYEEDFLIVDV